MNFIHFGCWNNGKCDTTTLENSISRVMNKINEHTKKNPINFAVIAGDNYYDSAKVKKDKSEKAEKSEKQTEKIKLFNKTNFDSV